LSRQSHKINTHTHKQTQNITINGVGRKQHWEERKQCEHRRHELSAGCEVWLCPSPEKSDSVSYDDVYFGGILDDKQCISVT